MMKNQMRPVRMVPLLLAYCAKNLLLHKHVINHVRSAKNFVSMLEFNYLLRRVI